MANLKEIRTRISSVTSTKQITSAMKMVAAAKLRKAQTSMARILPYSDKMKDMLSVLCETLIEEGSPYTVKRENKNILAIAVASNKGLCGGFNSNISKAVVSFDSKICAEYPNAQIQYYCVGKKVAEMVEKHGLKVFKKDYDAVDSGAFDVAKNIANELAQLFLDGTFDKIYIISNKFVNAAVQNVEVQNFLPLDFKPEKQQFKNDYIFEPDKTEIINTVIPMWLSNMLYSIFTESCAGEHGARMTAMNKATDNATELIKDLNLVYNKLRQASITNEIIEIVSGANAAK